VLSQENRAIQRVLPTPNDASIVIYIRCIKGSDMNVKVLTTRKIKSNVSLIEQLLDRIENRQRKNTTG